MHPQDGAPLALYAVAEASHAVCPYMVSDGRLRSCKDVNEQEISVVYRKYGTPFDFCILHNYAEKTFKKTSSKNLNLEKETAEQAVLQLPFIMFCLFLESWRNMM